MGAGPNTESRMKSTWRTDKSQWKFHHRLYNYLALNPTDLDREVPVHQKSDKMPYVPHLEGHRYILIHAVWPIALHQLYVYLMGSNMSTIGAFIFYTVAYKVNAIRQIHALRALGHKYGYLDGDKHERDQVPDQDVSSVFHSLSATATVRPMMCTFLAYRRSLPPSTTNWWWIPLEVGLYGIILDFWFYWYHRAMHDIDGLWKHHRKHHMTKHPNPLLSLYADTEQEIFDIAVIPLLTYGTMKLMGLPMGFVDFWICHQYVVFTELWGHSGLRVWTTPPTTATPLLYALDSELITEDHDLHHRKGWKKSHNYGKQTKLWDNIFGTGLERLEQVDENIDWSSPVTLPLF
jgi:sterol desaturase/sphingolipid hydroxylase (fatty acid hydroxylase superfamily)